MRFTVSGKTRIPTDRDRDATITWLTPEERHAARTFEQLVGDPDLIAWFRRQEALGAGFNAVVLATKVPLDLDDPVSVLHAMYGEAFWTVDAVSGDPPELPEYDTPPGAVN